VRHSRLGPVLDEIRRTPERERLERQLCSVILAEKAKRGKIE